MTDTDKLILAIDPGTHCGYAMACGPRIILPQCGTIDLSPKPHEGAGMRYLRFQRWLNEVAPTEIYYEAVMAHKGSQAAHIYGALVGIIQSYGEEHHAPYAGVPVGTIKKHATGKGGGKLAGKPQMIAAACERLGYIGNDDNTADALWILHYAIHELGAGK